MSDFEPETLDVPELSPLSIQAAALIRSIDALSYLFWIAIIGTVISVFIAGLAGLESNAGRESLLFGEYEVPRSILPPASLAFATFLFWLTASRLRMLDQVLTDNELPIGLARQLFELNPPVLHVFEPNNAGRFAPLAGISVYLWMWSVFFGNSAGLVASMLTQRGGQSSPNDFLTFVGYELLCLGVMVYGARSIVPVLRNILEKLHGETFKLGYRRLLVVFTIATGALLITTPGLVLGGLRGDELIGPHNANAMTADTLYIAGQEVRLFGIQGLPEDEICTNGDGQAFPCGRQAVEFLQTVLSRGQATCHATIATGPTQWLGACFLASAPVNFRSIAERPFVDPEDLASTIGATMVRSGWAIATGPGREFYGVLQDQAQQQRLGMWQGTVDPRRARSR